MKTRIEASLQAALEGVDRDAPPRLRAALHHAVFPGGARVRPRLALAVSGACGGHPPGLALATGCALELLHCASLVHDDLPCFDDADLRRGRPSVHKAFGEPLAVLAGDALILLAFETVARSGHLAPERLPALMTLLAEAAGPARGLVAGQAWESEPEVDVARYHRAKTGALFVAATRGGALAAGADPQPWTHVGMRLGEAYQVADDLCDAHATAESAGKPTQCDVRNDRPSAVTRLGTAGALARLQDLVAEAVEAVPACEGQDALRDLVVKIAERLVPASLQHAAA